MLLPMPHQQAVSHVAAGCRLLTFVDFPLFADIFTVKVPWFTPGFSYCRWWGVTCCLTASEAVLPICSFLQSVGMITLTGEPLGKQTGYVCCMHAYFVTTRRHM